MKNSLNAVVLVLLSGYSALFPVIIGEAVYLGAAGMVSERRGVLGGGGGEGRRILKRALQKLYSSN